MVAVRTTRLLNFLFMGIADIWIEQSWNNSPDGTDLSRRIMADVGILHCSFVGFPMEVLLVMFSSLACFLM